MASTNTVASHAEPEPMLALGLEEGMIVGIDVHKATHTAALIDERGVTVATLRFANNVDGVRRLHRWLAQHDATAATVGVENAAGYGQLVCAALAASGYELLNVPGWRTHRDRQQQGPGKSDTADAAAIGLVVLRSRDRLGPALEPELIRAIALLETLRRQLVCARTDAILRLRAVWTQLDPHAEAQTRNVASAKTLRRLRRLRSDGIAGAAAALCIRELADQISHLNQRIRRVERELAALLRRHGDPLADLTGAGPITSCTLIGQSGDVRRFRSKSAYARYGGSAPIPCGSGATSAHQRLHRGGNRQINAALHRIAITQARSDPRAQAYLARKINEGKTPREARRALKRHLANTVYQRLHTWANTALPPLPT